MWKNTGQEGCHQKKNHKYSTLLENIYEQIYLTSYKR